MWQTVTGLRPRWPVRGDAVAALVVLAGALALQATTRPPAGTPAWFDGPTVGAVAAITVVLAPLAYRRVAPGWAALAYQLAFELLPDKQTYASTIAGLVGLVLLYGVAARCAPRVSLPITFAPVVVDAVVRPEPRAADTVAAVVVAAGLWTLGWSVRRRRLRRAELLRAAVAGERARIAHELNDLVAHQVLGIVVQAGAGPDAAGGPATALAAIEGTAREALAAMRRMLRVLRTPADLPDPAAPTRWPAPAAWCLAALPLLLGSGALQRDRPDWYDVLLAGDPVRTVPPLALAVLAVLFRRRAPAGLLLLAAGAQVAYEAAGGSQVPTNTAVLLAAYAAGAWAPWQRSLPAVAAAMVLLGGTAGAGVPVGVDREVEGVFLPVFVAVGIAARAVRRRRDRRRQGQDRAALEVERARLARELHDVVAHHLSGIVVQAGAARLLPPAAGTAALAEIGTAGRDALAGLRRLLALAGADGALVPQPGLAEIDALLDAARAAGLEVRADVRAAPGPELELFAHRVVQEALTNVVKHAAAARVAVEVRQEDGELAVRVRDDGGRGQSGLPWTDSGGYGLAGMAERVALLGGTLTAGRAGAGWSVEARVPAPAPAEESRWASVS